MIGLALRYNKIEGVVKGLNTIKLHRSVKEIQNLKECILVCQGYDRMLHQPKHHSITNQLCISQNVTPSLTLRHA